MHPTTRVYAASSSPAGDSEPRARPSPHPRGEAIERVHAPPSRVSSEPPVILCAAFVRAYV